MWRVKDMHVYSVKSSFASGFAHVMSLPRNQRRFSIAFLKTACDFFSKTWLLAGGGRSSAGRTSDASIRSGKTVEKLGTRGFRYGVNDERRLITRAGSGVCVEKRKK